MTSSTAPGSRTRGAFTDLELRSLRELHTVLERVRPRLDAAVEAAATRMPAFASLMQSMDPAVREAQAAASRSLERAALVDGDWEPYAASLRELGALYAHMGIEFEDWCALLSPYRAVIEAEMLPASLASERAVLSGMNLFLDRAMAALAEAYIDTKQQLVRRAEAQLELYIRLFQVSPIGKLIYEWDAPPDRASFRLVAANACATAMTGLRTMDRLDRALGEGCDLTQTDLAHRLAAAIEVGAPQRWTEDRVGSGTKQYLECQCFPMGPRTVGVIFEDVTERRRTQDALAQRARELERSNRELDDFAYVASHDLKAPLRDIDSLATWITEDAMEVLPSESARHLSTIRDRIARMERLLDDLLQYSRAGRASYEPEPLDLREVVIDVLAVCPPPPRFEVAIEGDVSSFQAPRVPLELVLRNLVNNAVKHHHREYGRIEIALSTRDGDAEIAVRDDGPGIAPEFHERVFRMFQTLRPRDEVEGSGMGLAIVKKVIESHGGRVTIQSVPGEGTTVRLTWPRAWSGKT